MSRLITFGCSHTYGHGLEDCLLEDNRPGPIPSKLAWPNHLGNMLGREVINMSRPGASNLEILCNILKFDFQDTDIVVILWTDYARDLIFLPYPTTINGLGFMPIGSWMTLKDDGVDVESWLNIHTDYDLQTRSMLYVHHAESYLNNKNIKNKSFFVSQRNPGGGVSNDITYPEFLKFNNSVDVYLWDIMFSFYDLALDGSHPGPIAQQKLAEEIYKHINE